MKQQRSLFFNLTKYIGSSDFVFIFRMSSKKKRPKFTYSQEQVLQALDAVRKGETVNSASKRFGIPQSTLALKASGKTPLIRKMGPKPILGYNIEEMLVNWIKALAD